jgi:hypothetical protein|tara:strand:- start:459 stop:749 length:291 start_codon:yes stop_codon:yes gene_type:complete
MLTDNALKVDVTRTEIVQANADYCPVTLATAKQLDIFEDALQVQRNCIKLFDQYDQIECVYAVEGDELENFMDSWDRYMLGIKETLKPFTFTMSKK